jgi:capsule polysaccharide export protein KpsE/RkpR
MKELIALQKNNYTKVFVQKVSRFRYYLIFVILPVLMVAIYFSYFVTEQYESNASILLANKELSNPNQGSFDKQIQNPELVHLVERYLKSKGLMVQIDNKINLKRYFTSQKVDYFSRLSKNPSLENFYKYYLNHININYDQKTGTINLAASAFDPEYAKLILETSITETKYFISNLSNSVFISQLNDANDQLRLSRDKFLKIKYAFNHFTKLNTSKGDVHIKDKNLGIMVSDGISEEYEKHKINLTIAKDEYHNALMQLTLLKAHPSTSKDMVLIIEPPSYASNYTCPRKIYELITLLFGLSIAYMIIKMFILIIKEHHD